MLAWTPHPLLDRTHPPLDEAELRRAAQVPGGLEAAVQYHHEREEIIRLATVDPLHHGFELPHWADARALLKSHDVVYGLGGNGSGKTELAAKIIVETLLGRPGSKVLSVAQGDQASKVNVQSAVYRYLPPELRRSNDGPKKRSTVAKISYSQAEGFTEGTFVLPNKSQCWFKTVEQWQRNKLSFEGPDYQLVSLDEPSPIALVDTLAYRAGKGGGKMLFTFTALDGYDGQCRRALDGARLVKSLPMSHDWGLGLDITTSDRATPETRHVIPELKSTEVQVKGCPPGHMPYILQPLAQNEAVICFWTQWNPFLADLGKLLDKARGRAKSEVRVRVFGWTEKVSGCQFPLFSPETHLVTDAQIPARLTLYCSCDPAPTGGRSYFYLWFGVDELERIYVLDESPRWSEGEWATNDGNRGDGAKLYGGRGVDWNKRHIREREADLIAAAPPGERGEVRWRKGDPRAFATEAASKEGGQSLFDLFRADGEEPGLEPMHWDPAPIRASTGRRFFEIEVINNLLAWKPDVARSVENEPRLYIHERCQNLIRSLLNWSPDQPEDSPWKDPVDTLRYGVAEPMTYVDPTRPAWVEGGGW